MEEGGLDRPGDVIAGVLIDAAFDGGDRITAAHLRRAEARNAQLGRPPRPRRGVAHPPAPASLLLSGDTLRIGHAGGTVCGAARLLEVGHAWGCVLLNSPGKNLTHRNDSVDLELDSVKLGPPPEPHPLAADVKLHAAADDTAIFWHKDRRIMGKVGKPITNEAGVVRSSGRRWCC